MEYLEHHESRISCRLKEKFIGFEREQIKKEKKITRRKLRLNVFSLFPTRR